jgi:2-oxoglutarate dehydrogenase E2 component (dihydrolipoamide succinyltransferase)
MPANVVVPEVGESIVDARVAKWLKKEGDAVNVGEPLVELETDKIDLEVAAPQAGVLGRIAHGDGADVKVGEVLGVIEDGERSGSTGASPAEAARTAPGAAKADASPAEAAQAKPPDKKADAPVASKAPEAERKRATPAARNAAEQNAVDLKQVSGSGDAGRVMKRDVEQAAQRPGPRPVEEKSAPRPATPIRESAASKGTAPKSGCACRNGAPRSRSGWSRRRAPPRC